MVKCPKCQAATAPEVLEKCGGICAACVARFARDEEIALSPDHPTRLDDVLLPLRPGTRFRNLEVLELIGRGGMGVVYKALQPDLDRFVALKLLSPALASDPEFARRFQREAKALAALSHPNIVHIHEYGREGNLYFLTMEFVDGVSLRELMRKGRMTPAQVLRIVPQICDALEYAHSEGVIHREIKPENILIDRKERVKIADFGLAKLLTSETVPITRTNIVMGTPQYMAPEQHDNLHETDHRADIYSLEVVFYEMLTGEPPMGRFDPPSKRAKVEARLDEVVLRALERRPERRYQRAAELKSDVETATSSPSVPRRAAPVAARRAWPVGLWTACACVVAASFMPWATTGGTGLVDGSASAWSSIGDLNVFLHAPNWIPVVAALFVAAFALLRTLSLWVPQPWVILTPSTYGFLHCVVFIAFIGDHSLSVGFGAVFTFLAFAVINSLEFYRWKFQRS